MDWETYQKEIGLAKDHYEEGFDVGARAADIRFKPIIDFCRAAVVGDGNIDCEKLHDLLAAAGEEE